MAKRGYLHRLVLILFEGRPFLDRMSRPLRFLTRSLQDTLGSSRNCVYFSICLIVQHETRFVVELRLADRVRVLRLLVITRDCLLDVGACAYNGDASRHKSSLGLIQSCLTLVLGLVVQYRFQSLFVKASPLSPLVFFR